MMLDSIKNFFEKKLMPISASSDNDAKETLHLATIALMLEVAESDFEEQPEEKALIKSLIKESFNLNENDTHELFKLAQDKFHSSTDSFEFTRLINQTYTAQQKVELIENLWRIAYADKVLDKYEDNIIRRIADLIYVSHKDFIKTKLQVEQQEAQRNQNGKI